MSNHAKANDPTKSLAKVSTASFDVAKQDSTHKPTASQSKVVTMRDLILEAVKTQTAVSKREGFVSDKLLKLAKPFQDKVSIGTYNEASADGFLDACKEQESFIRSKEARGQQVDKLPRCWTQAKSNIKAAMIHGLKLSDFNSESALRKAVSKARNAHKGSDPVNDAVNAFKADIQKLPRDTALKLMKEANAAVAAALASLVPVEPQKPAEDNTEATSDSVAKITQH